MRRASFHNSHVCVAFERVADRGAARAHIRPQALVLASRATSADHVRDEVTLGCLQHPVREGVGARVERVEEHDGADAFAYFALDSTNHKNSWWFELAPGNNSVTVTLTGGSTNSTLMFEYPEGWE